MRVSIVESDPGYVVDAISYRVTLNGEPIQAVTADEETGECWVWDEDAWRRGVPQTKRVTGVVRVERWEADHVEHPPGTVGFLDQSDGWWVWCSPEHPDYARAKARATHFWDHEARAWLNPKSMVRN